MKTLTAATLLVLVACSGSPSTGDAGSGGGTGCTVPPMPSYASLPNNAFFPDPFLFMNGTRMTTKAEWSCRRAELATLAQGSRGLRVVLLFDQRTDRKAAEAEVSTGRQQRFKWIDASRLDRGKRREVLASLFVSASDEARAGSAPS